MGGYPNTDGTDPGNVGSNILGVYEDFLGGLFPKPRREKDPKRKVGKNDIYGRRLVDPQKPGDFEHKMRKKLKGEEG
jgi:hypothetical protein